MNEDVTVIIIGHKSKSLILNYIKPIHEKFKIIIIDNSDDFDLTDIIKKNYPNILIKNVKNDGYGAAINYGSKLVKTKYFLISNPDLTGINENSLNKFTQTAKKLNDKFSTLGPRYEHANPKTLIQSNKQIEISEFKVISGACMFFNKRNFEVIGGFDENFFMYLENDDLCKRLNDHNENIFIIPKSRIKHLGGKAVTEEYSYQVELSRNWHWIWSKFYFNKKHYGFLIALLSGFPTFLSAILKSMFYSFTNKKKKDIYYHRALGYFNALLGRKSNFRVKIDS